MTVLGRRPRRHQSGSFRFMQRQINSIMLADDDEDDCILFGRALRTFSPVDLTIANDGEQLMGLLRGGIHRHPDVLFLDLNMPRKNGSECLHEIRGSDEFEDIVVIIYSTSYAENVADHLYQVGASYYIRKPADFSLLKDALRLAVSNVEAGFMNEKWVRPPRNKFRLC